MSQPRSADFGGLPVQMTIGAAQRLHAADSLGFYVRHRGDSERGLLNLYFEDDDCLLVQERDFDSGRLIWRQQTLLKADSSEYFSRLIDRDPDGWIIELDGVSEKNPFERLG